MKIRAETHEDLRELYAIHRDALGPYVEATWGWDEEFQAREFRRRGERGKRQVIEEGGRIAGFIAVDEQHDRLVLNTIELAPEFQRLGIGTRLIQELLARAGQSGVPVHLRVLKCNPARSLYERLGFEVVGETETHFLMRATRAG